MATHAIGVGISTEETTTAPSGGFLANEFVQAPSGRAAVVDRPFASPANDTGVPLLTDKNVQLPCGSAVVAAAGVEMWWDSANDTLITYPAAAGWYAGTLAAAKVDGVTSAVVALNRRRYPAPISTRTADSTLTAFESGTIISNVGASGTTTHTLPAAIPGLEFGLRVGVAQALRFDPNGSETVSLPGTGVVQAAGKYLTCSTIGCVLMLKCFVAGTWSVISSTGTWTIEA